MMRLKARRSTPPATSPPKAEGELDLLMASLSLDITGYHDRRELQGVTTRRHAAPPKLCSMRKPTTNLRLATSCRRRSSLRRPVGPTPRCAEDPARGEFFGPPGTGFTYDCIRYGLKSRDNQELADLYVTMLSRRCEQTRPRNASTHNNLSPRTRINLTAPNAIVPLPSRKGVRGRLASIDHNALVSDPHSIRVCTLNVSIPSRA